MKNNSATGLLTFDDDSPLFISKKKKLKRKPKKKVTVKAEDDIVSFTNQKPKRKKKVKPPLNKNIPKYSIKSPADCKHILPAFKKILAKKWEDSNSDNNMKVAELVNYLRGAANVVKLSRPKEYEELRVLMQFLKG